MVLFCSCPGVKPPHLGRSALFLVFSQAGRRVPDLYWRSPRLFPFLSSFEWEEDACALGGQFGSQLLGQVCSALPGSCRPKSIVLRSVSPWFCPEGVLPRGDRSPSLCRILWDGEMGTERARVLPVCLPSSRGQMLGSPGDW